MVVFFTRKKKFVKITCSEKDGGDPPHSSSAKIKLIVVAEKSAFLDLYLYEHLKVRKIMNREGE